MRIPWAQCLLLLALGVGLPASAMTIRPMTDAQLVGSSDLVVLGTVTGTASGEARGRIVTWVDVTVERTLKGRVAGDHIRLTEAGGRAGDRRLVIPGAPTYHAGERVMLFLREWGDGLLRTNSFVLGKYRIERGARGETRARRGAPAASTRGLDDFVERVEVLAADGPQRVVANGITIDQPVATSAPFQIGLGDPGDLLVGRWFEADCGVPVEFQLGNVDPILGDAATRQAVEAALAAWTTPATGSIELQLGADVPTVPSDLDGINSIVFEDPFDEVLSELVGCAGVLAIGGFYANGFFGLIDINGVEFERNIDGFVVMNDGVSECFGQLTIEETLGHEIGHAIGFGHSSENPSEPDADLADALMYWRVHNDGRGALLGADDLAGLAQVYPAIVPAIDPLDDAIEAYVCQYNLGPFGAGCGAEAFLAGEEGITVPFAPIKKYDKAARIARKALTAPKLKKVRKFVKKSRKLSLASAKKAQRFFDRGRFVEGCFDDIIDATDRAVRDADALIPQIEANL